MQQDITERSNSGQNVGWFAAGAMAVAGLVALFLYADGYFNAADGNTRDGEPRLIIEAKK